MLGCRAISWLGNGVFWYALMLALLLWRRDAALAVLHMAGAGVACTVTYKLLKRGTLRPRPYQVQASIAQGASVLDTFSFPSGHTLHAVAFSVVALAYYPSLAGLLVPFTLLTAVSRVVLGLHYPSDVLSGATLGAVLGAASLALV
ncbi:MAG TPA: phosphatase PAP2 family protein [Burkholderiales bacterium]|nr:phosphatase PAP2 family protein [Burkholderiales bacterium]